MLRFLVVAAVVAALLMVVVLRARAGRRPPVSPLRPAPRGENPYGDDRWEGSGPPSGGEWGPGP